MIRSTTLTDLAYREKLYTIVTNRILAPYGREMTWEVSWTPCS